MARKIAANSSQTLRVESAAWGRSNVRESSVIVNFRDFGVQIQNSSRMVAAFHKQRSARSRKNLPRLPFIELAAAGLPFVELRFFRRHDSSIYGFSNYDSWGSSRYHFLEEFLALKGYRSWSSGRPFLSRSACFCR